jgi:hypothetical protein
MIRAPFGMVDGTVTDVNLNGLFVRTSRPGEIGRIVAVRVQLPDGPMDVFGLVRFVGRSSAGHGMGVELLVMAAPKKKRWTSQYHALLNASFESFEQLAA